jgi:hypothetical protein
LDVLRSYLQDLVGLLVNKVWVAVTALDLWHCKFQYLALECELVRAEGVEGQVLGEPVSLADVKVEVDVLAD